MECDKESEIIGELFLLCRLCIVENGKFAIIPGSEAHTAIRNIYGVKIDPYDGLSQLMCVKCKEKLTAILSLRTCYLSNQETLAALKDGKTIRQPAIVKEEPDNVSNDLNQLPNGSSVLDISYNTSAYDAVSQHIPIIEEIKHEHFTSEVDQLFRAAQNVLSSNPTNVQNAELRGFSLENGRERACGVVPAPGQSQPAGSGALEGERYHNKPPVPSLQITQDSNPIEVHPQWRHVKTYKKKHKPVIAEEDSENLFDLPDGLLNYGNSPQNMNTNISSKVGCGYQHTGHNLSEHQANSLSDFSRRKKHFIETNEKKTSSTNNVPRKNTARKRIADTAYKYHCRLCNDDFNSILTFKQHRKSHANLLSLQSRYTPYVCTVRLFNVLGDNPKSSVENVVDNSEFYVNRTSKEPPKVSVDNISNGILHNEIQGSDSDSYISDRGFEDEAVNYETNIAVSNEKTNCDSILDPKNISDTIFVKQIVNVEFERDFLHPEASTSKLMDSASLIESYDSGESINTESNNPKSIYTSTLPPLNHTVNNFDFQDLFDYKLDNLNVGSILMEANSVLEEDLDYKFDQAPLVPFDRIAEYMHEYAKRYCQRETDAELEKIHLILLSLCKRKINISWKEVKSRPEIILSYKNRIKNAKSVNDADSPFHGFTQVKTEVAKKSTVDINVQIKDKGAIYGITLDKRKVAKKSTVGYISQNGEISFKHIMEEVITEAEETNQNNCNKTNSETRGEVQQNSETTSEMQPNVKTSSEVQPNSSSEVQFDSSSEVQPNSNSEVQPMSLPVIVSTATVGSSFNEESTSVYIDLEDEQHIITSHQNPDLASPISFFKHILERQQLYLVFKPPSSESVHLACFRKNIESGDFIVSISKDDNIFYVEVCKEKEPVDLSKENHVTQWTLLSMLSVPKIETLMKNYARKASLDGSVIEAYIKILKSISGSVENGVVTMEAPDTFFF